MYSVLCANALGANWEANWKVRWHALTRCKPRSKSPTRGHWFRSDPFFSKGNYLFFGICPRCNPTVNCGIA